MLVYLKIMILFYSNLYLVIDFINEIIKSSCIMLYSITIMF